VINIKNIIINLFKGLFIGIANVIPGVSGGTIVLLLGIYERLLESIGSFFSDKTKMKERFLFILNILVGVLVGILLFAKVISFLNENYPEPTSFFFIGLILASIPFLISNYEGKKINFRNIVCFFCGFNFVLLFLLIENMYKVNSTLTNEITLLYGIKLFIVSFIAAGTMVVPGVSGSFLLILLGEYYNILNFINTMNILPLVIVSFGVGLGILIFSKIINWFLKKHKDVTMSFIIGLVIASVFKVFVGFTFIGILPILNIIAFTFGAILVIFLGKKS